MATFVYKDAKLWTGGYDVSGDHMSLSLSLTIPVLDATTFGQNSRVYRPGLHEFALDAEGYVDHGTGAIEEIIAGQLGAARIVTVSHDGGDAGETAWLTRDLVASYQSGGAVGDMHAFSISGTGTGTLARGLILEDGQTARTTTFDGTGRELGAVASGKTLYGSLHVVATGGSPTLDVIVESDASDSWAGSETTRLTFSQQTAIGSEWQSLAGPITDTWYRISATIGGSTPSLTFVVAVGIG